MSSLISNLAKYLVELADTGVADGEVLTDCTVRLKIARAGREDGSAIHVE